jgi:hypothetical protein
MVGQSYSERWYRNVVNATPAEAKAATQGSLARIATTETSESFNTGRAKYLDKQPALGLLRVWDATLDKRGCPICAGADGTIVGANEPFPWGEPGAVHPMCRCCWTLLRSTETGGETLIEPRAATTQVQVPGAASPFAPKGIVPSGGKLAASAETKALAKRLDDALGNVAKDGGASARAELRTLLGQHGIKARSLGTGANAIKITDPSDMGGMAGFHEWDGTIRLAPKTLRDSRAALRKIQLGVDPGDDHAAALNVLLHEEIHGASAMTKAAFQGPGAALEEVATELAARRVTSQLMGREIGAVYADEIVGLKRAIGSVSKAKPEALAKRLDAAVSSLKSNARLAKTSAQHIDNFVDALKLTPAQRTKLTKQLNETEWWKPGATPVKKPAAKVKAVKAAKPKAATKPRAPPKPKATKKPKVDTEAAKVEKARLAAEAKAAKAKVAADAKAEKARLAAEAKAAKAKAAAEKKAATKAKQPKLTAAERREAAAAEKAWREAEKLEKQAAATPKALTGLPRVTSPVGRRNLNETAAEMHAALASQDGATARKLLREHVKTTFPEAVSKDIWDGRHVLLRRDNRVNFHDGSGRIEITERVYDKALKGMDQLASGEMDRAAGMSAGERFVAYKSREENPYFNIDPVSTLIHEELHGHSRGGGLNAYSRIGALLEEVGTELSARHAMSKLGPGFEKLYSGLTGAGSAYDGAIDQVAGILKKHVRQMSDSDARHMLLDAHRTILTDGPKFQSPEEHLDAFVAGLDVPDAKRPAIRADIEKLALPDD